MDLIRYLVPDVLNGALVDSLSGHALSAAGLAASFLLEANEQAQLAAPPTSICSVIKAQKPGWLLFVKSKRILQLKTPLFISSVCLGETHSKSHVTVMQHHSELIINYSITQM